jgi:hypothetical protein
MGVGIVPKRYIEKAIGTKQDWKRFQSILGVRKRVIFSAIGWGQNQALLYVRADVGPGEGIGECLLYEYAGNRLRLAQSVLDWQR